MANKVLVLGVGNSWRHDDGIGPKIIQELQQQNFTAADLLDGGIDGLALLDHLQLYDNAIIIDAVNMNTDPGTIRSFTPAEINCIQADALSTHGFGLAELIALMQKLTINTKLKIIGVQPQDIEFGEGLTAIITAKIPDILTKVKSEVSCITP